MDSGPDIKGIRGAAATSVGDALRPDWHERIDALGQAARNSLSGAKLYPTILISLVLIGSGIGILRDFLEILAGNLSKRYMLQDFPGFALMTMGYVLFTLLVPLMVYLIMKRIIDIATRIRYSEAMVWLSTTDTAVVMVDSMYWDRFYEHLNLRPIRWLHPAKPTDLESAIMFAALHLKALYDLSIDNQVQSNSTVSRVLHYIISRPFSGLYAVLLLLAALLFSTYLLLLFIPVWLIVALNCQHAVQAKLLAICDHLLNNPDAAYLTPELLKGFELAGKPAGEDRGV